MTDIIVHDVACYDDHHNHPRRNPMPMIDVYAAEGTFADKHELAKDLAAAVMKWEQVPNLALFRNNTAAFFHDLPAVSLSNVVGETNYVRVRSPTPYRLLPPTLLPAVLKL